MTISQPQTPREARNWTWQWIRARCSSPTLPFPIYSKLVAGYWQDTAFREHSMAMERLYSETDADLRAQKKVAEMTHYGREMCRRVLALEGRAE